MALNFNKASQFGRYFGAAVVGGAVYLALGVIWGLDNTADMAGIVDLVRVPLTVAYGGLGAFAIWRNLSHAEKNRVNSDLDAIATSVIKRDKALQRIKNEKDPNSSKVERAKKDIVKYTEMQIKHATRFERSYKKHRSGLSKQLTAAEVKQVDQFIAMGKKGKLTSISQLAVRKI